MNKHISFRSSKLLESLNRQEQKYFSIVDAMMILSSSKPSTVRRLLADMTKRGLILRVKDGLYNVIPYEKNSKEYIPNWHLTSVAIAQPYDYYLGFYTALDIHGLVTQPSLKEQIVTENQIVPKYRFVKEIKFEFINLQKNRFFGYEKTWIDDFNKVNCSDLEKTIIDCLYKPNLANGIVEVAKAIFKSRGKINSDKMLMYLEKFNAQVVYKRLGFILQNLKILLELKTDIRERVSNSYTLLDPSLPKSGKHYSEWKIVDNVGIDNILNSIET